MADETIPPAASQATVYTAPLPDVVSDMAYESWAAFQKKFTGGEKPPRREWDRRMKHREMNPGLGHPFEDCAVEGAIASFDIALKYIKRG